MTVDEKRFGSEGRNRWPFRTMCATTRFILSTDVSSDKLNYDAKQLFADMVEWLGRQPRIVISDRLRGFYEAFMHTLGAFPDMVSIHIANAALNGKRVDDNQHERGNGDLADRINAGTRGFNSDHRAWCPCIRYATTFSGHTWALAGQLPRKRRESTYQNQTSCSRRYGAPRRHGSSFPDT